MVPHVRLKPGAEVRVLAPAGVRILAAIDRAAQHLETVAIVTSGSEERGRKPTDPHMTGEAFDVSVAEWDEAMVRAVYRSLRSTLGAGFTVLLEAPALVDVGGLRDLVYRSANATGVHFHIQRKKGTRWP
jgi:hypothetical protein